jgi:hypothetical protein
VEHFYLIQKLIDRSKTYCFGPLIIGTKAKRFDLVRLLSERKQNNFLASLHAVAGLTVFASIPAFDGVHTVLAILLLLSLLLLLAFLLL